MYVTDFGCQSLTAVCGTTLGVCTCRELLGFSVWRKGELSLLLVSRVEVLDVKKSLSSLTTASVDVKGCISNSC